MKIIFVALICFSFINTSCQNLQNSNSRDGMYEIKNFELVDSLSIEDDFFIKLYRNKLNDSIFLKEIFLDSARNLLLIRGFMKGKKFDGPIYYYNNSYTNNKGVLSVTGHFSEGFRNGEWRDYDTKTGKVTRIYFYKFDRRFGTWKYFDSEGKEIKTEVYD